MKSPVNCGHEHSEAVIEEIQSHLMLPISLTVVFKLTWKVEQLSGHRSTQVPQSPSDFHKTADSCRHLQSTIPVFTQCLDQTFVD